MRPLIVVLVVLSAVVYSAAVRKEHASAVRLELTSHAVADEPVERADPAVPTAQYHCDGRTRCPEMRSCEEATWFLGNCPGMKMDGDRDGAPCEDQWCGPH